MYLWNIIRDFFVKNIFGGLASDYSNNASQFIIGNGRVDGSTGTLKGSGLFVDVGNGFELTICDYLSTFATIIVMALLVICAILFVRWIFRLFAGLFSFR